MIGDDRRVGLGVIEDGGWIECFVVLKYLKVVGEMVGVVIGEDIR